MRLLPVHTLLRSSTLLQSLEARGIFEPILIAHFAVRADPPAEEVSAEQAEAPEADVVKAPQVPTRMYFLRMPKPDVSELELKKEQISAEVEAYQQACAKALAAAKLAKEHRLQREEEHKQALEQFNMSKQDRSTLLDRLRPLRDVNKRVIDERKQMGDRKSQLPASTVAELDAKINELEFRQAHEPMDRRSENNLIADIRKLKKTRPEVMKYEMDNQQVSDLGNTHDHSYCLCTFYISVCGAGS